MRRWFLSCVTSDNLVKHLLKHRQAFNPDVFRKKRKKCAARSSPDSKTPPPLSAIA
jgi:hypothetical protein